MAAELDPVDLAVLSSRFSSIVRKMSNTLLRAGRSVILNTGRDFSCCVVTGNDEMLSMAESIPVHVLCGPDLMARSMRELHPDSRPGDAFLHNSPYHGNSHPADLSILVPVFDDDGRHRFTIVSKAHVADIGNASPTAYAADSRDVYEEGARDLPVRQGAERLPRHRGHHPHVPGADPGAGHVVGRLSRAAWVGPGGRARAARARGARSAGTGWTSSSRPGSTTARAAWPRRSRSCPTARWSPTTCHDPFEQVPDGIPVKADRARSRAATSTSI